MTAGNGKPPFPHRQICCRLKGQADREMRSTFSFNDARVEVQNRTKQNKTSDSHKWTSQFPIIRSLSSSIYVNIMIV